METGGQCVMITGPLWMLMWLVDSLDTLALVCKEEQSMFVMLNSFPSTQIQLLIPVHTLDKTVLLS